ncbi:NAD-dependent epimerase/dehydratase family protein [Obesumbacterium proteus]|uniref:pyridine nucleotide transhydrogenase n=1 Tax=Obesumbacterium proteus TaxID=82983 RepID=UPI001F473EEB|nr:pyridine nucleotide transhydrogenase [Obesumbacterium proteus]MCE9884673.1 pyridine nucleotide transhydrogenase [Obesumbacterium proteus]MCE9916749.1 pyridine nucleotide transhydrogenase [Obesumbacterium proteus]MCE9927745.1 pyridine nucleotide transhydrogenase [Obesumbacterium proteus]MCG2875814.1 pyridine nucleotide transhydrogenase [Obesumbacterium proteus]
MKNALIGFTGFVGSTLLRQTSFEALYRSTNIADIEHNIFDTVVCAGAPAQKWLANKNPDLDSQKINGLIAHLKTIKCKTFILISTVDVFKAPLGVNESTPIDIDGLHAYGLNRRRLELFVEKHFENFLIVRLPGLVGPRLRKNIIFDFLNENNLHCIDTRSVFQFYPMVNLWFDIQVALKSNLKIIHLTGAPLSVADVALHGFGIDFERQLEGSAARYDMQTQYASMFGGKGLYQYSIRETVQAIRAYAQSEPITLKSATKGAS